jgi:diadenosine tetraphosphatase ApaH/serine/threonine PP2A family protein phosphatase
MRLAVFADIHANLEAFTACLAHATENGADSYAFVGDLVGYGADPAAVLDLVQSQVSKGAIVVRGNHDAAAVNPLADTMNATAERAIDWTRTRLGENQLAFLAGLPLLVRRDNIVFVHSSAEAPGQWIYVTDPLRAARSLDAAKATYVFSGHVHEPMLYYTGAANRPVPFSPVPGVPIPVPPHRRWLAIAGSVGQPRDGNPAAGYALADLDRATLTFFRVPYDWHATAAKIRAAGLPESLARRLQRGE